MQLHSTAGVTIFLCYISQEGCSTACKRIWYLNTHFDQMHNWGNYYTDSKLVCLEVQYCLGSYFWQRAWVLLCGCQRVRCITWKSSALSLFSPGSRPEAEWEQTQGCALYLHVPFHKPYWPQSYKERDQLHRGWGLCWTGQPTGLQPGTQIYLFCICLSLSLSSV